MCQCWDVRATPTARLLLLALADRADDSGLATASLTALSEKLKIDRRVIVRSIGALIKRGLLAVEPTNGTQVNTYRVLVGATVYSSRDDMSLPSGDNMSLPSDNLSLPDKGTVHVLAGGRETEQEQDKDTGVQVQEHVLSTSTSTGPVGFLGHLMEGWERHIGLLTGPVSLAMKDFTEQYPSLPDSWADEAVAQACFANARRWPYIKAILERWATQGRDGGKRDGGGNNARGKGDRPYQHSPTNRDGATPEWFREAAERQRTGGQQGPSLFEP